MTSTNNKKVFVVENNRVNNLVLLLQPARVAKLGQRRRTQDRPVLPVNINMSVEVKGSMRNPFL